jgi:hypothetical protein
MSGKWKRFTANVRTTFMNITGTAASASVEEEPSHRIETASGSLDSGDKEKTVALPLSKLCSKCRNIFDHWDRVPTLKKAGIDQNTESSSDANPNDEAPSNSLVYPKEPAIFSHYDSLLELEGSAKKGCTLCTQFLRDERIIERFRGEMRKHLMEKPHRKLFGWVEVTQGSLDGGDYWGLDWKVLKNRVAPDVQEFRSTWPVASIHVIMVSIPEPGKTLRMEIWSYCRWRFIN